VRGKDGVTFIGVGSDAVFTIVDSSKTVRSFNVNLSTPVPGGGGVSLGTVSLPMGSRSARDWVLDAQWQMVGDTLQNMHTLAVGQTVTAAQMNIAFAINGRRHILQMGPQPVGHCDGRTLVHGTGTTSGTIQRKSQTKWAMDLPTGSIGRLFDVQGGAERPVDMGLYYVHLHYEIGH